MTAQRNKHCLIDSGCFNTFWQPGKEVDRIASPHAVTQGAQWLESFQGRLPVGLQGRYLVLRVLLAVSEGPQGNFLAHDGAVNGNRVLDLYELEPQEVRAIMICRGGTESSGMASPQAGIRECIKLL